MLGPLYLRNGYAYKKDDGQPAGLGCLGYLADRSDYQVWASGDGYTQTWLIDEKKGERIGDPDRWTIYAADTQVPGGPPDNADYFMAWAYRPLVLRAPPGGPVTVGGVGYGGPDDTTAPYWYVERYVTDPDNPALRDEYVRLRSGANPDYYLTLPLGGQNIPNLYGAITLRNGPGNAPDPSQRGDELRWYVRYQRQPARVGADPVASEVA